MVKFLQVSFFFFFLLFSYFFFFFLLFFLPLSSSLPKIFKLHAEELSIQQLCTCSNIFRETCLERPSVGQPPVLGQVHIKRGSILLYMVIARNRSSLSVKSLITALSLHKNSKANRFCRDKYHKHFFISLIFFYFLLYFIPCRHSYLQTARAILTFYSCLWQSSGHVSRSHHCDRYIPR